jgi:nucleoid-associated protein YgaU
VADERSQSVLTDDGVAALGVLRQAVVARAAQLARRGRYPEAEQVLLGSTAGRDASPAALDLLARIRAQQGRFADAERLWSRATELDPANQTYAAGLRLAAGKRRGAARPAVRWAVAAGVLVVLVLFVTTQFGRLEGAIAGTVAPPTGQSSRVPAVERALAADSRLAGTGIAVREDGRAVLLSGTVPSFEQKALAEMLAGPGPVDSHELAVVPPPLAAAVSQALRANPRTAGLGIEVEQVGDGVRLSGTVPTQGARQAAENVARGVNGVGLVDSEGVRVKPYTEYVVRPGDTLDSIARAFYGDSSEWPLIYLANRDQIGDPNHIEANVRLAVPVEPLPQRS